MSLGQNVDREIERVERALDAMERQESRLINELNAAKADRDMLAIEHTLYAAALSAVRDMHGRPRTERIGSGCVHCGLVWPCPTYRRVAETIGNAS